MRTASASSGRSFSKWLSAESDMRCFSGDLTMRLLLREPWRGRPQKRCEIKRLSLIPKISDGLGAVETSTTAGDRHRDHH